MREMRDHGTGAKINRVLIEREVASQWKRESNPSLAEGKSQPIKP